MNPVPRPSPRPSSPPPARGLLTVAVVAVLVAAAILLGPCRPELRGQARRPGVGYTPTSGINTSCDPWAVRSIAVASVDAAGVVTTAQPHSLAVGDVVLSPRTRATVASVPSPTTLALNGSLPAPGDSLTTWYVRSLMACRYGPRWEGGSPGPHATDYERYMREDFANRVARWHPDYPLYDGNPTEREINDAYYSRDRRVLPLPVQPTPTMAPTPLPSPTIPPPRPTPTLEPTPGPVQIPPSPPTEANCRAVGCKPPVPQATPTVTPTPACEVCDRYEAMPARHRETYLAAPYWKRPLTRVQQQRLNEANAWTRAHGSKWYVPDSNRSSGNITQSIGEWDCEASIGGWVCSDEEMLIPHFVRYPAEQASIALRGGP